jgi:hypothetical protein
MEQIKLTPENAAQIISRPRYPTDATHVITKIQWGIEILCVIQISNDKSSESVDKLLQNISKQLENSKGEAKLNTDEKSQIDQLTNVTIYGPGCYTTNPPTSLNTVLTKLLEWQKCNHRLVYTMHSLRWIFNDTRFMETINTTDKMNSSIGKIQSFITDIKNIIRNLEPSLDKYRQNMLKLKINQPSTNFSTQFYKLSKTYEQFFKDCKETVIKLRRGACETKEIDQILLDQRYSSLKTDLDTLYRSIQHWLSYVAFIERLKGDQIEHMEISKILPQVKRLKTFEEINDELKSNVTKWHQSVVLCYSSDQLKQKNEEDWEKIYKEFKQIKQKKTEETRLIYVDFTEYEQILPNFIIVTLPEERITTPEQKNQTRK